MIFNFSLLLKVQFIYFLHFIFFSKLELRLLIQLFLHHIVTTPNNKYSLNSVRCCSLAENEVKIWNSGLRQIADALLCPRRPWGNLNHNGFWIQLTGFCSPFVASYFVISWFFEVLTLGRRSEVQFFRACLRCLVSCTILLGVHFIYGGLRVSLREIQNFGN